MKRIRDSEFMKIIRKKKLNWTIPLFYPYRVWKRNSLGVYQKHFPRDSGTKIIFPRGSGQVFQRDHTSWGKPSNGVIPGKLFSYGPFLASPPGIPTLK